MPDTWDEKQFRDAFKGRSIVITDLPTGRPRQLADTVNETTGRGNATLSTKAEYAALYRLLLAEPDSAEPTTGSLTLATTSGPTAAGRAVEQYLAATVDAQEFFDEPMYVVDIQGWPGDQLKPAEPVTAPPGATVRVWRTDPRDTRHLPPEGPTGTLFTSGTFSLSNTGNRTANAPKRSWKIDVDPGDDDDRVADMSRLNLKAMWNDPSQMREALAWALFAEAGVPAPRHTYAKLGLNGVYKGLFSLIEQVDGRFLKEHFGANDEGNLYKAYCGDIGCATLEHRTDANGDGGSAYRSADPDDGTYRLKTNESQPQTHEDLARFVRVIHGLDLPGGPGQFDSDAYRESMQRWLNVPAFLRWAGVNVLLGSWDNYFATPANYYLYNSGPAGGADRAVDDPYFTFIPWDYDNSFGIDYSGGTQWQYADLVDWPSATHGYWAHQGHDRVSAIPLVTNLLANRDLLAYYLDHLEHLLDTSFTPAGIAARMGTDGGVGLWQRVSQAAYLESDTPAGAPFTERQFSNDEVYRAGFEQYELLKGEASILGIYHYVRMRYDRARSQLADLRRTYPAGSSGASFPAVAEPLPTRP